MPTNRIEIKGNKYGEWVALGDYYYRETKSGRKLLMEKCKCICGVEKYVQRAHLLSGASTNCGCIRDIKSGERARLINLRHGMEGTIPYKKYMSAKARCNNKNNDSYYRYGGRGIKMGRGTFDEFWRDMKDSYYEHCKQYGEKDTTLDRIDVNGNYCKENCRWATWEQQYNNMSNNHGVYYKGKFYQSISMLCKAKGMKYGLVKDRITKLKWSVEDAIDKPCNI